MEYLINKTITEVYLNEECTLISFLTIEEVPGKFWQIDEYGLIQYVTYGDCCSFSYIENINNLNFLFAKVTKEEEKYFGHSDEATDDEDIKMYSYEISTTLGTCSIEFRNDSNGYYGGEMKLYNCTRSGIKQSLIDYIHTKNFKEITKDI